MTQDQRTPGPWNTDVGVTDKAIYITQENGSSVIAKLPVIHDPEHREANARLIAAAPELLEALQGMYDIALVEDADREEHQEAMDTEANHVSRCAYCTAGLVIKKAIGE